MHGDAEASHPCSMSVDTTSVEPHLLHCPEVMLAGGTEAAIDAVPSSMCTCTLPLTLDLAKVAMAGFCRLGALSTHFNETEEVPHPCLPQTLSLPNPIPPHPAQAARASRPFDTNRDGFVMGEACTCWLMMGA